MNKLLWFVGGCLAGFITATVLGTDDENSFDQSDMMVDNDDVLDEDMPEAEDSPLFPEKMMDVVPASSELSPTTM